MTALAFTENPAPARLSSGQAYALVALVVVAAAALWQMWIGLLGDATWLVMLDERWLAGEKPYVDFLEINPPASLLIYAPEVWLAKLMGVRSETVVSLTGFVIAGGALALSGASLRRAGRLADIGPVGFAVTLFALLFLPGDAFMERDVIAAALLLPALALGLARAEGAAVDLGPALAAGVGVGLALALKPPYGLAPVLPAAYVLIRRGPRAAFRMVEIPAAAAVVALYGAVAVVFFPAYAANMGPAVVDVYLAVRESLVNLLLSEGGRDFVLMMLLGAYLGRNDLSKPALALPALAALGAFVGYCVQGKGWNYQAYPAVALAAIFAGLAFERATQRRLDRALGAFALVVALAVGAFVDRWGVSLGAGVLAAAALRRELSPGAWAPPLISFAAAAALGATAAAAIPGPDVADSLGRALVRLKPHPTVVAISESFGFSHPMVRKANAIWVQSVPNLVIASGARRRIDERPRDAALAAQMRPYIERDRARLVADITDKQPDAILVGPLDTRFHAWIWADPEVQAAMRDYRLLASNDRPDFPAELWARREAIGLKPGL